MDESRYSVQKNGLWFGNNAQQYFIAQSIQGALEYGFTRS